MLNASKPTGNRRFTSNANVFSELKNGTSDALKYEAKAINLNEQLKKLLHHVLSNSE